MKTDFFKERIPVWALCALINGDYSGLEDEDITLVEKWLEDTGYNYVCCPDDDEEPYFDPFPPFGLATDVIDCYCAKF